MKASPSPAQRAVVELAQAPTVRSPGAAVTVVVVVMVVVMVIGLVMVLVMVY